MNEPPDLQTLAASIEPHTGAPRESRLEPYRAVILGWRAEGYSYRKIQRALAKHAINVSAMAIHAFVRRRQAGDVAPVEVTFKPPLTAEEKLARREAARASNHTPASGDTTPEQKFSYDPERPLTNRPAGGK